MVFDMTDVTYEERYRYQILARASHRPIYDMEHSFWRQFSAERLVGRTLREMERHKMITRDKGTTFPNWRILPGGREELARLSKKIDKVRKDLRTTTGRGRKERANARRADQRRA